MYGYNTNDLSGNFLSHFPVTDDAIPSTFPVLSSAPFQLNSLVIPNNEFDSLTPLMKQEYCYTTTSNTSSGCSTYDSPSSLTSYRTQTSSFMRSDSSHLLQKNINGFPLHQPTEFLGSDSGTVRKAFSTGDLEQINMVHQYKHRSESPLSNENSIIQGINTKACRYSPEEKKEKIERYISKRNQRNFNKKIKYVCRKTLADSRPRIRGRFARNNDENEKAPQSEWNQMSESVGDHEDLDEYDENWINFMNAFSANLIP